MTSEATTATTETTYSDLSSIDDILARFARQYVLLDRCKFSEKNALTHARVVRGSADRDEVYAELRRTPNSIILFAGPGAEDEDGAFLDGGDAWESTSLDT